MRLSKRLFRERDDLEKNFKPHEYGKSLNWVSLLVMCAIDEVG